MLFRKKERDGAVLRRTSVLFINFGLLSRGVRKDLAHFPATVTEVSCPSFAFMESAGMNFVGELRNLLMFGVRNIHWGSLSFARFLSNIVKFFSFASRWMSVVMES